ncbi:MAG TPA: ATP-binding protein [Chloroflexia bacterium]|nr:ATP-binding protein [Chloroflexia bacterium]
MTLSEFFQYLTWSLYVLIFVIATIRAVRRPVRANIDIAVLFSLPALIIGLSLEIRFHFIDIQPGPLVNALTAALILAMAYMLLRLVDDFSYVPRWVMRSSEIALALLVIATSIFSYNPPFPLWLAPILILYIVVLLAYTAVAFVRESRRTSGVTMRRMRAVAVGSIALCAIFALAGLGRPFQEEYSWLVVPLTNFLSLASGVSYFLGFAPPGVLRRAWQEPELRAFLGRAASFPRLPTTEAIITEMEHGTARSLGTPNAKICLWNEREGVLKYLTKEGWLDITPQGTVTGRSFLTQQPIFSDNLQRDNPARAAETRAQGAVALLSAPITAGENRLGVLTVYAPNAPIFADEDLALVQLLADQAAVILESRALIDEAARVRAQEEATRMKDDFLSAAAHDLKTPLTTLVVQSELLERRAARTPGAPADLEGLRKMTKEVHRLKDFVLELLDASRAEQGKLLREPDEVDLAAYAQEVCARHNSSRHPCIVEADGPVTGMYDSNRIAQLIENLVENAVKYSPDGGAIRIRLWRESGGRNNGLEGGLSEGEWNHFTVTDEGIGIPKEDLPHVFERFHRGTNVNDRSLAGMGLGLFICRGIVEQHGGRIWVDQQVASRVNVASKSQHGDGNNGDYGNGRGGTNDESNRIDRGEGGKKLGTTFHVALPVRPPERATQAEGPVGERGFAG